MTYDIRVRPVTRYIVTRFYNYDDLGCGGSETVAQFDCESYANEVAEAMRADPEKHKRDLIAIRDRYANEIVPLPKTE